ncbi:TIGR02281 family clan AA aspartic protease [Breoghania sp.]|uniref:retropepsin-like aspartic protease family protein n=1 Tax=Breoghania sp. TaxID=2065378 RepID=UPI0026102337|nr:TIGR02281 family clan AA aspartic protease [Breoghania sp.]MDJ0933295.1 TIGR02281 family clan AA aspartic protease [Breoghania sp.]
MGGHQISQKPEPVKAKVDPVYRPVGHGTVVLEAEKTDHFAVTARINRRLVDVLVDTSATAVALPYEEAVRLGMRPGNSEFTIETSAANGIQKSAPVTLREVRIDTIRVYDVPALVAPRHELSTPAQACGNAQRRTGDAAIGARRRTRLAEPIGPGIVSPCGNGCRLPLVAAPSYTVRIPH